MLKDELSETKALEYSPGYVGGIDSRCQGTVYHQRENYSFAEDFWSPKAERQGIERASQEKMSANFILLVLNLSLQIG